MTSVPSTAAVRAPTVVAVVPLVIPRSFAVLCLALLAPGGCSHVGSSARGPSAPVTSNPSPVPGTPTPAAPVDCVAAADPAARAEVDAALARHAGDPAALAGDPRYRAAVTAWEDAIEAACD